MARYTSLLPLLAYALSVSAAATSQRRQSGVTTTTCADGTVDDERVRKTLF